MRYNEYRSAQINGILKPGVSTEPGQEGARGSVRPDDAARDGLRLHGHVVPGAGGRPRRSRQRHLRLLAARGVLDPRRAVSELVLALRASCSGRRSPSSGPSSLLVIRRYEVDVFSSIGLVMLIALAAKNAILIVEFSKAEHDKGASLVDAALSGARLRLRPILMTAFAFILGVLPLAYATGSGAASRRVLGTTVLGGMLAATHHRDLLRPNHVLRKPAILGKASTDSPAPNREHRHSGRTDGHEPRRSLTIELTSMRMEPGMSAGRAMLVGETRRDGAGRGRGRPPRGTVASADRRSRPRSNSWPRSSARNTVATQRVRRGGPAPSATRRLPARISRAAPAGTTIAHVEILHRAPDRRHRDLDPDGAARARRDGAAARSRSTRTSRRPRSCVQATYIGADALTIEEAVATPIEAQMTGVDNMLYMYSTSTTSGGQMSLRVVFDVEHRSEHGRSARPDARTRRRPPSSRSR